MECSNCHSACILDLSFKYIYHDYYFEFNIRKYIKSMHVIASNSSINEDDFNILFMKINYFHNERLKRGFIYYKFLFKPLN